MAAHVLQHHRLGKHDATYYVGLTSNIDAHNAGLSSHASNVIYGRLVVIELGEEEPAIAFEVPED